MRGCSEACPTLFGDLCFERLSLAASGFRLEEQALQRVECGLRATRSTSRNSSGKFHRRFNFVGNVRDIGSGVYTPRTVCKDTECGAYFLSRNSMFQLTIFEANGGCCFSHEAYLGIGCSKIQSLIKSVVHSSAVEVFQVERTWPDAFCDWMTMPRQGEGGV